MTAITSRTNDMNTSPQCTPNGADQRDTNWQRRGVEIWIDAENIERHMKSLGVVVTPERLEKTMNRLAEIASESQTDLIVQAISATGRMSAN